MQRSFILLMFLLSVTFAVPVEVESEAFVVQPVEVNVTRVISYELTIENELVPGIPEIVGKTYSVAVTSETNGVFLNGNGSVLIGEGILHDDSFRVHALQRSESAVTEDLARIEHIKKYGAEGRPEELRAYATYFQTQVGSLSTFYSQRSDILQLQKIAEELSIQSNGQTFSATVVTTQNGMAILQADGIHFPSIQFSGSENVRSGDTVYIVPSQPEPSSSAPPAIEPAVVTGTTNGNLELDRPVPPSAVVVDSDGNPIAVAIEQNDSIQLKTSEAIEDLLDDASIPSEESPTTRIYRQAMDRYRQGDYAAAQEKLDALLDYSPYHSEALFYRERAQELLERNRSPLERFQAHPWRDTILIGASGMIVLFLLFRLLGKRR
jgi:TolA-binding protein